MRRQVLVFAGITAFVTFTAALASALSSPQVFRVRDDCDPVTFNAAPPTGPGLGEICNPSFDGDTTFAEFIEELSEDKEIGSWRFNPDEVHLDRGQGTIFESRAGEFHTFTRVANFGGGFVPDLNALTGAGPTVPECNPTRPPDDTNIFVPDGAKFAGPKAGSAALPKGKTNWQCCIHPWMRSEIEVR